MNRKQREKLLALCQELREDDAVDARDFHRRKTRSKNPRTLRLCKQVADTLSLVLSGEFSDEILQSLDVYSVQPAPDAGRLLVIVQPLPDIVEHTTPVEILEKLQAVSGILRREVAAAISRRKTPSLTFDVVWPQLPPSASTDAPNAET